MQHQEIVNTVGNRYVLLGGRAVLQDYLGNVDVFRAHSYATKHSGFVGRCYINGEYLYGPMVSVKIGPDIPVADRRTANMAMKIAAKRVFEVMCARWLTLHPEFKAVKSL